VNASRSEVIAALTGARPLLLMTHEHPDGDAIGSLVAMHRILESLGISAPMLIGEGDDPAEEYHFLVSWDKVQRELPADLEDRTLVMLDCGNYERSPLGDVDPGRAEIVNIDHHHDNTRFGTLNLVIPEASCTAEIVWGLSSEMGATIDLTTAQALYAGLITDTGRFMYSNTGVEAHRMAGELIELGVEVEPIYRRIYEGVEEGRVRLLARALGSIERHERGALTLTWLTRDDFDCASAPDDWSEGIIDHLRAIQGTAVAAVIREPKQDPTTRRISLRAARDGVDVSLIAREGGGGGHKGAAGFSSRLPREELLEFIRAAVADQVANSTVA